MKLRTMTRDSCEKMARDGKADFVAPHSFVFHAFNSKVKITFRPDLPGLEVK